MRHRWLGLLVGFLVVLLVDAPAQAGPGYGAKPPPPQPKPAGRAGHPTVPQHHQPPPRPPVPSPPTTPDHGGFTELGDDDYEYEPNPPTPPPGYPPDDGGLGEDPPSLLDDILGALGFGPDDDDTAEGPGGDETDPGDFPWGLPDLPEPPGGDPPHDPPDDGVDRLPRNADGQPIIDLPLGVEGPANAGDSPAQGGAVPAGASAPPASPAQPPQ